VSALTTLIVMSALAGGAPIQRVPAADIARTVTSEVKHRLREVGSQAQFALSGRVEDQSLPAGELRIVVGDIAGRWPRSRVAMPVRLLVDGRPVRTVTVWVEMREERTVPTYAESYPVHRPMSQLRTAPAVVDMMCCAGPVMTASADDGDLRLKRAVRAGQPLLAADFESLPDVVARQQVAIEVDSGAVRLQTVGLALHDGRIGDRINVRRERAQDVIRARVIGKQKVVVE
jgi:flagellar basal body P-ring formation protein FlgA